jgi:hypothetical protein
MWILTFGVLSCILCLGRSLLWTKSLREATLSVSILAVMIYSEPVTLSVVNLKIK